MRGAIIVLSVFAALWAWAAIRFSGGAVALLIIPIAISITLAILGWRGSGLFESRGAHVGKVVGLWSAIEVAALIITANVLEHIHRPDLMMPLGAVIVGLHFFPLARGIPVRFYHGTGAALVIAGLAGLLLPAGERPLAVGMSAAIILWATALLFVLWSRKAAASPSAA